MGRAMDVADRSKRPLWWAAVAAIAVAGLLLRIAAAQGGLWTDEAWSATYAAQAGGPLGVFWRINHDNNHHLISLWLQAVGEGAAPWLARVPAILAGSAAIVVAALLVARVSKAGGLVAAVLFAISPILVTYGSEARGYALMVLAALVLLLLVNDPRTSPKRPIAIAAATLLGMFSHLTMIAVVVLVTFWVYLERRPDGPTEAARSTARLMGPALVVAAAVLALVFGAAAASPLGMQVGGYAPFAWADYGTALDDLSGWTFGLTALPDWLRLAAIVVAAAWVAIRSPAWLGPRGRLYAILILGVPLVAAVIQPGNIQFARYFLLSAIGLLLLSSEAVGRMVEKGGAIRVTAFAMLAVITSLMLAQDRTIVEAQRGYPEHIVSALRRASPQGARVAIDAPRLEAVVRLAALRGGYPLQLVPDCASANFVLAGDTAVPACGGRMTRVASGRGTALSGDDWALYGR